MSFWGWVAALFAAWCVAAVLVCGWWCLVCNRIEPRRTRWDGEQ
jgi:hypothetical protein